MAMVWAFRVPAAMGRQAVALRRAGEVMQRAPAAAMAKATFIRAAGGVVKVLGLVAANPGGGQGGGPGAGVSLPEAWRNLALPAGYLCPLLGQLALLRGEVPEYDAAAKCLRIGGRVLIGTAGKDFVFASQASADMWVSVNRAKAEKELILLAELPPDSLAALRAKKGEAIGRRAGTVTANAAKQRDAGKSAAMAAEADFYLTKWG